MANINRSIAIAWNGLPTYAARLLAEGRKAINIDFQVIATKPKVPCTGIEDLLPQNLQWLTEGQPHSWKELGLHVPKLFIHTGWRYPHFTQLANEVRSNGGQVIGMFDNNWKATPRQILGAIYFRLFLRRKYLAAWVPGQSGAKLARLIGFSKDRIYQGMYGADPSIFNSHTPLAQRPKTILYVGQFIERKNILGFVKAFIDFRKSHQEWNLKLIGCGPLESKLTEFDGVSIQPFAESVTIAQELNQSRFLVLPSFEEHWGLVIHEACLSGTGIIVSNNIGAAHDLAGSHNSILLRGNKPSAIRESLNRIPELNSNDYERMEKESTSLARKFGPQVFANTLQEIISLQK